MDDVPFWRRKTLSELSPTEWESLCDGCGRCCLNKLEDEDTGRVYYTDVGCRLLDGTTCRCKDYRNRSEQVGDCVKLSPDNVADLKWLPPTCGYRLVARGRVAISEEHIGIEDYEDRIVSWPSRMPPRSKRPA